MLLTQLVIYVLGLFGLTIVGAVIYLRYKYHQTKVNEAVTSPVVLKIAVPRRNEKSPLAAEQLFSALHGIGLNKNKAKDHFSFEIAAGVYGIHFIVVIAENYRTFVENQIYAQYPDAQITKIDDYTKQLPKGGSNIKITELELAKTAYLPIRTFPNFDVDPLAGITGAISNLNGKQQSFIQILARPIADSWQKTGREYINSIKETQANSGEQEKIKFIESKSSKAGFQFLIRILTIGNDEFDTQRLNQEVIAAFSQYRTAILNSLDVPKKPKGFLAKLSITLRHVLFGKRIEERLSSLEKFTRRVLPEFAVSIVNTEELASLYHLPNSSVEAPNIAWSRSKKLEYPLNLPTTDCRIIGETDYRGNKVKFGIRPADRLRHAYVIGKTGVGKSTLMEGMIMADIYEGNGVGVIDPHGEMINNILEMIPEHRKSDVVIFDPGDTEYPVGLNLLQATEEEDKSLITDGIVSVFKKEFGHSWGPRLEYILTNSILTLLHCQNISILVLPRLLSDNNYRKFLLKQLHDPILKKFWEEEYAEIAKDPRRKSEEISSILNKVGRFTTNPIIRNITGQVTSSFDIKDVMDNGKILLVNLAQGKIGEENMSLLGGMLVTRIYTNVTRRIRDQEKQRRPFYLYIDEFQNFSTSTFEKILSEARKFGLSLTIAHQFIDQIEEGVRNAIFGNVGTVINFGVGPRDADFLSKEFAPYLQAEDLVNLARFEMVVKLSIDIAQSKPFTARALTPNFPKTGLGEEITTTVRRKYAKPREMVEQKLYKWAGQTYNKEGNLETS